jgi:hypothetical protein
MLVETSTVKGLGQFNGRYGAIKTQSEAAVCFDQKTLTGPVIRCVIIVHAMRLIELNATTIKFVCKPLNHLLALLHGVSLKYPGGLRR